ncbi:hypothetical protein KUTeg_004566 [Tegillarca granosa]|uniref:Mitochondrial uncoupling protein 4 n=1 Tax=Tegillarca granosa TaxID=220873 RepID=A0ABQ9FQE7_TEGGR|nr:hypothetical protein KUTeg_004566 [Tegillarca granosa]
MSGGSRQSAVSSTADSFIVKYFLSVIAATVAETVTYPLDLTKTRLQIQGEGGTTLGKRHGMIGTAVGIVYTGCRMSFYEVIRDKILGKNPDGTFPLKASLGGLVAGAAGQFFASPTDLVKVQMQMEGRRPAAFKMIVKESGFRGLYRGWVPNVQRAALVNMGDLCTYDTVKHQILKHTNIGDNYYTHTLSSFCSGLVAATVSTPADVVKTRMMNQPIENGRPKYYKGTIDCFVKTVKTEGTMALFKGYTPCWMRLVSFYAHYALSGLFYKGSVDCLVQTVTKEGFMALYKGFVPIWSRMKEQDDCAPWSLTFWLTYEQISFMKLSLNEYNF